MTEDTCEHLHLLLQAELDGELDAAGTAALLGHLDDCPGCLQLRRELGRLSADMRQGGLTRYAAPAPVRAAVTSRLPAAPRHRWNAGSHATAFGAGLAVAAAATWLMVVPVPGRSGDLVDAHIRALLPGHLLDVASSDQHTVKPWFDGRIAFAPVVPDLAAAGFPLIGGRLDTVDGRSVAALVYGRDKHLINVFVGPGAHAGAIAVQGYNIVGWTRDGLAYDAVSDLNRKELEAFARLMQGSR